MLTTSINLLERVRRREDQSAWERFVSLYSPVLFRWAQCSGLSNDEAADLVQDLFLILLRELPEFEYDARRGSFRGWLKTVTTRLCRDRLQLRRPHVPSAVDVADPADTPSEVFWEREYQQFLIRRAFDLMRTEFEPSTWQACWEHTVSGRTAADVGRELGMSEAAVYVAKSRVLRRLREELAGMLD